MSVQQRHIGLGGRQPQHEEDIPMTTPNPPTIAPRPDSPRSDGSDSIQNVSSPRTTVNRELKSIHVVMIAINATLGAGLYYRGGEILELAGPLAVVISFILTGIVASAVMQGITEMLCIWPIPGALAVYVERFVDEELGIAVGITYWLSAAVAFSGLVAVAAAEIQVWILRWTSQGRSAFTGLVMYLALPIFMIGINSLRVNLYGWFEVVVGLIKMGFLAIIIVVEIVILAGAGNHEKLRSASWNDLASQYDTGGARNWGAAFLMCFSIAIYAYIGVEVVAATALEVQPPNKSSGLLLSKWVRRAAIYVAPLAIIPYVLSSVLASILISSTDCHLPRADWVSGPSCAPTTKRSEGDDTALSAGSSSVFVIMANYSEIPHLGDLFTALLIITALTCANTMLYVASRTLFGITRHLPDIPELSFWHWRRVMAFPGRTTKDTKVPVKAVIISALSFAWVPFLQLVPSDSSPSGASVSSASGIGKFIDTLGGIDSTSTVIVWACSCIAYIRFYKCIKKHHAVLKSRSSKYVLRYELENVDYPFPWRSPLQPVAAYFALFCCTAIILGTAGASFSNGFQVMAFSSSYLVVIVFLVLWIFLKWTRDHLAWKFWGVNLTNVDDVIDIFNTLHGDRQTTSSTQE